MKVGDLVSVNRSHGQAPIIGLVLEIYVDDDGNGSLRPGEALVQPCDPESNRLTWAHPLDLEVISESR
jgi:hypothetical protein